MSCEEADRLRALARHQDRSLSSLVRVAIRQLLADQELVDA